MSRKYYCVRDNQAGYMPEGENAYYDNLPEAEQDALWRVRNYREEGYTVKGSLKERFYTCTPKDADDYTINSVIVIDEVDKWIYEDYEKGGY